MTQSNRVVFSETVRGERAYVYGFKARARDHHCLGYGTFDVTIEQLEPLRKRYSRQLKPITNLPIYLKAVALTVQRNPEANAILFRKFLGLKVVRFEQVDVNLPITRQVGRRWITFVGTIRNAAAKSLLQIQEEISAFQRCPPEESFSIRRFLWFDGKPLWLARLIHWRLTRSPSYYIRNVGTCGLTLVESVDGGDRLFPIAPTSVVFGLGAARKQPVVRGDSLAVGRVLRCVLMADNFVIPGRLGARLVRDFTELLETGSFIEEELCQRPGEGGAQ
jgi:pyruvate/2-oxoglutarate dehydrogenase complex dihydrolipoamide acyltransferase (E2) component